MDGKECQTSDNIYELEWKINNNFPHDKRIIKVVNEEQLMGIDKVVSNL